MSEEHISDASQRRSSTGIIAANSFWYGLELAVGVAAAFVTSIVVARTYGPKQLGYFSYIAWLTNLSGALGALGIPSTTRKYMAEYLGCGSGDLARGTFRLTMRLQLASALCIASFGLVMVFTLSEPSYRYTSAVLVLALVPRMVGIIPSLANVAAENFRLNVPGALIGTFVNLVIVILSVESGWGLLGVAIALCASSCLELCIKLAMTLPWIRRLAPPAPLPPEVKHRMFRFSAQSIVLMVIEYVVWDRSDVFFLRLLNRDIRQITFFTLALNLTDKVLMVPGTLGGAIGVSVMAEYARDREKLRNMVSKSVGYMLVISLPLLLGIGSLSRAVVHTLYGQQYYPVVVVLSVAALFAIPKALLHPVQELLQAAEDQNFVIVWSCVCGVVNVALDFLLVPRLGALGAAVANGVAQTLAVLGIWMRAARLLDLPFQQKRLLKIFVSGAAMAAVVTTISLTVVPWLALGIGTLVGAAIYCAVLRFTAALTPDDRQRLLGLGHKVPQPFRIQIDRMINFLVPMQKECEPVV